MDGARSGPLTGRRISIFDFRSSKVEGRSSIPISYARSSKEALPMQRRLATLLLLTAPLAFAANDIPATAPPAVQKAMKAFDARALAVHDKFLASDLLEGRGPGTRGDDLAMEY